MMDLQLPTLVNDTHLDWIVRTVPGKIATPSPEFVKSIVSAVKYEMGSYVRLQTRDDVIIVDHLVAYSFLGKMSSIFINSIVSKRDRAAKMIMTSISSIVDTLVSGTLKCIPLEETKRCVDKVSEHFDIPTISDDNLPRWLTRFFDRVINGSLDWAILVNVPGEINDAKVTFMNPMLLESYEEYTSDEDLEKFI